MRLLLPFVFAILVVLVVSGCVSEKKSSDLTIGDIQDVYRDAQQQVADNPNSIELMDIAKITGNEKLCDSVVSSFKDMCIKNAIIANAVNKRSLKICDDSRLGNYETMCREQTQEAIDNDKLYDIAQNGDITACSSVGSSQKYCEFLVKAWEFAQKTSDPSECTRNNIKDTDENFGDSLSVECLVYYGIKHGDYEEVCSLMKESYMDSYGECMSMIAEKTGDIKACDLTESATGKTWSDAETKLMVDTMKECFSNVLRNDVDLTESVCNRITDNVNKIICKQVFP